MGDIGCAPGIADGSRKSEEAQNAHQVLQANGDWQWEHVDFAITEQHGHRHIDRINSAARSLRGDGWAEVNKPPNRVRNNHGADASADDPKEEELSEFALSPVRLKH